jgi:hypothetical protein
VLDLLSEVLAVRQAILLPINAAAFEVIDLYGQLTGFLEQAHHNLVGLVTLRKPTVEYPVYRRQLRNYFWHCCFQVIRSSILG